LNLTYTCWRDFFLNMLDMWESLWSDYTIWLSIRTRDLLSLDFISNKPWLDEKAWKLLLPEGLFLTIYVCRTPQKKMILFVSKSTIPS
jgi:hypothetical protein